MKKEIIIAAEPRATRGKGEARRLRRTGRIPAIFYGAGKEPAAVAVDPVEIGQILFSDTGHNTIFSVSIDGQEPEPAMVSDWQFDPVKDDLLHVDLERIRLDVKMQAKVPIQTTGEARGVKTQGGLLEVVHREVLIECLPTEIPAHIEVDVTEMGLGDTVRAADLTLPTSVELLSPAGMVICHVVELRTSTEEEEEAEAEAPAEGAAPEGEAKE